MQKVVSRKLRRKRLTSTTNSKVMDDKRWNFDVNNRDVKLLGSGSKGARTPVVRCDRWCHRCRRRMSPRRRWLIPSSGKHHQRHFSRPIAFPLGRSIKTRRGAEERRCGKELAVFMRKRTGLVIHSRRVK